MEPVCTSETSATSPIPTRCNCTRTTPGELTEQQNAMTGAMVLSYSCSDKVKVVIGNPFTLRTAKSGYVSVKALFLLNLPPPFHLKV
jgi:hypothetical protein